MKLKIIITLKALFLSTILILNLAGCKKHKELNVLEREIIGMLKKYRDTFVLIARDNEQERSIDIIIQEIGPDETLETAIGGTTLPITKYRVLTRSNKVRVCYKEKMFTYTFKDMELYRNAKLPQTLVDGSYTGLPAFIKRGKWSKCVLEVGPQ